MLKKFLGLTFVAGALLVGVSASAAYDFGPTTLKVGSTGAYVSTLQTVVKVTADGKFGPMTAAAVKVCQASLGLTADGVAGPITKAAISTNNGCTKGTTPTPDVVTGGAGELSVSTSTSGLESSLKEGEKDVKVLAFKGEGDGSDIKVTSMKLVLKNDGYNVSDGSSEKLTNYVDEVKVFLGSTEVGSLDASDFTRDSGSPDTYTKTVSLSNAVVKEDVKSTFYVTVSANSSIDSEDMDDASWNVDVQTVRYTDGTGAILSDDLTGDHDQNFTFEDVSTDDDISIKSSSNNPAAATLQVETDKSSDEMLVGAFKLDVDDNSSDITVTEIPVVLTFEDSADTAASDDAEDLFDSVMVKIDGEEYEADLDSDTITNGDGTATYLVTLDDGDLVIDAGDQVEVKVYVTFTQQDTNYGTGSTVSASVTGSDIDAEGEEDEVTVSGTFTGKTHTLSANAPVFRLVSKSLALYQAIDGVGVGQEDVFLAKFVFNVTAADDDVYLSKGVEGDANYTDYVSFTQLGGGAIDSQILEAEDDTLDDGLTSSFLITAGDTEKFTLSFYVRGNNEAEKFTIDGFSYGTADDTAAAYVYGSDVTSGLSSFATNTTYLAK